MRIGVAIFASLVACEKPAVVVKDDTTLADPPKDKVEQVIGTRDVITPHDERNPTNTSIDTVGKNDCHICFGGHSVDDLVVCKREIVPGSVFFDLTCPTDKVSVTSLPVVTSRNPENGNTTLVIRSEPAGRVRMDGVPLGITPFSVDTRTLAAGTHDVTVTTGGE